MRFKLLLVLLLFSLSVKANTFKVKYDLVNRERASLIVVVGSNEVVIADKNGAETYSLTRLGTIQSSGVDFDSYAYGSDESMFCVSRKAIKVSTGPLSTISGYVILIGRRAYLADLLND